MKKSILFIVDEFYPVRSAPPIRIHSFISQLNDFEISVLGGWSAEQKSSKYTIIKVLRPNEKKFLSFIWFLCKMNFKMRSLARKYDIIVLSIPKYELLFSFPVLKKKCQKLVLDIRDSINFIDYVSYFSHFFPKRVAQFCGTKVKNIIRSRFIKSLASATQITIANTGIATTLGKYHTKATLIPNGVDTTLFRPPSKTATSSTKRSLNLVYIGNFAEKDRFDLLYSSLPKVDNVILHLVGSGRNKHKICKQLREKKITYIDHGIIDHQKLPLLLKDMDVGFIFRDNDVNESIPVALFEFCAMNIVSIVNDVGLMSKFVKEHDLGFVVKNPEEIISLLSTMNQDPAFFTKYDSLHDLAQATFSRQSAAVHFKDLLLEESL